MLLFSTQHQYLEQKTTTSPKRYNLKPYNDRWILSGGGFSERGGAPGTLEPSEEDLGAIHVPIRLGLGV